MATKTPAPDKQRQTTIDIVEQALDAYVSQMSQRRIDPKGFRVSTLALLVGKPSGTMSQMLQRYRLAQARQVGDYRGQTTRYVIAARSYGPNARWRILAKPGSDPKVVREARREQAKHIARDAYSRVVSDLVNELYPALGGGELDQHLADTMDFARRQFEVVVNHVDRVLVRDTTPVS